MNKFQTSLPFAMIKLINFLDGDWRRYMKYMLADLKFKRQLFVISQQFEFKAHIFHQIMRVYHIGVRQPVANSKVNVAS